MLRATLIGLVLLTGCAESHIFHTDERLRPYVQLFEEEVKARGKKIDTPDRFSVVVVDRSIFSGSNTIGRCIIVENNYGLFSSPKTYTIQISDQLLEPGQETALLFTIFHEIGHCVLKKKHNNQEVSLDLEDGDVSIRGVYPASIMNERYHFYGHEEVFMYLYDEYVDELLGIKSELLSSKPISVQKSLGLKTCDHP